MKPWSRGRTLLAGVALIVLSNAVALSGVWWNREGEPEALLNLSERELALPFSGRHQAENSGLALKLLWRAADHRQGTEFYSGYPSSGGNPDWLNAERMAALGFVTAGAADSDDTRVRYLRQLPREVMVVLELDGPAKQQALEAARENARRHEAAAAANPDSKEFTHRAKSAKDALEREGRWNSRLFAVDVGLDLAALRTKYPDRGRFMILHATVRPHVHSRDKQPPRLGGFIGGLSVSRINVPFEMRPPLAPLQAVGYNVRGGRDVRFDATIAVGKRLEPWLVALQVAPARP